MVAQKTSSESSDSLDEFFNNIEAVSNNRDLTADDIAKKALQKSSSESLDSLDDLFSDNDDVSKPLQFASGCYPKEVPPVHTNHKKAPLILTKALQVNMICGESRLANYGSKGNNPSKISCQVL